MSFDCLKNAPETIVNVLGTEYRLIESDENTDENLKTCDGYCDSSVKICVVSDMTNAPAGAKKDLERCKNEVKRHELIHAFLFESGLDVCGWADNEELVDWIAKQFPKIANAFIDAGIAGELHV